MVSFGAVLGVNSRYVIYKKLEKNKLRKDYIILVINTVSSFFLGLFISILPRITSVDFSYKLVLFISIGFFGSLSTFSTFIYDVFELCNQFKFSRAIKLFLVSLLLGITSFAFGFLLGNQ